METCCGIPVASTHLWGIEKTLCQVKTGTGKDGMTYGYTGKELIVTSNQHTSSVHFHERKTETFYVERGTLEVEVFRPWPADFKKSGKADFTDKSPLLLDYGTSVQPGGILTILPLVPHRFYTLGEIVIFKEFSTWDDPEDSYRVIQAGPLEARIQWSRYKRD